MITNGSRNQHDVLIATFQGRHRRGNRTGVARREFRLPETQAQGSRRVDCGGL